MYAVIAHGGKQYRVSPGDVVQLEKIPGDAGDSVELTDVRLFADDGKVELGEDAAGKKVVATVVGQGRGPKIIVFKKKRRKQYRRTQGHRQYITEVRIDRIE